jgi:hypothetical protein
LPNESATRTHRSDSRRVAGSGSGGGERVLLSQDNLCSPEMGFDLRVTHEDLEPRNISETPELSAMRLVKDEFGDSSEARIVVAGDFHDHRRFTTTLSDHDIPEHKALPELAVLLGSSGSRQADDAAPTPSDGGVMRVTVVPVERPDGDSTKQAWSMGPTDRRCVR